MGPRVKPEEDGEWGGLGRQIARRMEEGAKLAPS